MGWEHTLIIGHPNNGTSGITKKHESSTTQQVYILDQPNATGSSYLLSCRSFSDGEALNGMGSHSIYWSSHSFRRWDGKTKTSP